jgi:Protein of unknown function (DUF3710)
VFRRRRHTGEHRPRPEGTADPGPVGDDELAESGDDELAEFGDHEAADAPSDDDDYVGRHALTGEDDQSAEPGSDEAAGRGPWDSGERYPQRERVDLGSLLIPVHLEQEVQLNVAGEQIVAASVTIGRSSLQVQAFAAPKSGDLWEDVRVELAQEIRNLGGQAQEADGPFGPELQARVPTEPGSGQTDLQSARYIGVDGPRWLLRGTISGQAATHPELARPLEELFADVVVVRGDHPAPPRDLLEIQLPPEMREAIEQEMAQAEERGEYPSPFERGPEITETR